MITALTLLATAVTMTPITTADKNAIRPVVAARMRDPESAHFRWLPNRSGMTYCGFVNAKNAYGGYVGFVPFLVVVGPDGKGKSFAALIDVGDGDPGSITNRVIAGQCSEKGIDLSAPYVAD